MLFKTPELASELPLAHPELRVIAHDLDDQLGKWKLGELTVTAILRNPSFYPKEQWSWHFCGGALDFRTREYSELDIARIVAWLQGRCFTENLKVDIVPEPNAPRGPHIHIEIEDHEWAQKWRQRTGAA